MLVNVTDNSRDQLAFWRSVQLNELVDAAFNFLNRRRLTEMEHYQFSPTGLIHKVLCRVRG